MDRLAEPVSALGEYLPFDPSTPGFIDKETPDGVLRPGAASTTPPHTPFTNAPSPEIEERPAKRQCHGRPLQQGQQPNNDVKVDDAYFDVFLAEPHFDDALLSLGSGASPETFISGDYDSSGFAGDEKGRAEDSEPNYVFQIEDESETSDIRAHSREFLSSNRLETPEIEVCFGMIGPVSITLDDNQTESATRKRIHVHDDLRMGSHGKILKLNGTPFGLIPKRDGDVLQVLSQIQYTRLQLRAIEDSKTKRKLSQGSKRQGSFYAIVYGPFGLSETVGDFLDTYDVFLQPPQGCNSSRRYRNPHALSCLDDNAPYTLDPDLGAQKAPLREWEGSSNYLDSMEFPEELEAPIPAAIETNLLKHQRLALYFMQQREKGWALTSETDVWGQILVSGIPMYRNRVNDEDQLEPPTEFRGGILADEMGLGKTLTVAALIASDREARQAEKPPPSESNGLAHTLVIVPPALLDTWEGELAKHCSSGLMHWTRHYRDHRFIHHSQLEPFDVILTTYETVRREWQDRHTSSSLLFRTHWHRLVLDEAHIIRNSQTKTAEAVCELHAERRWAVTGTPIQNHVTDFVALLQFLRVAPYDQPANFDRDIVQLWKVDEEEAISRLKRLITCIGLRRTSGNIELPPRTNYDQDLYFNPQEKQLYDAVDEMVESIISSPSLATKPSGRMNALQGINALRLVCNFGTLTDLESFTSPQLAGLRWGQQEAQNAFNVLLATGATKCSQCRTDMTVSKEASLELLESNAAWEQQRQPEISQCGSIVCGSCALLIRGDSLDISWCEHGFCASHPVSSHETAIEQTPSVREPASVYEMPTKIKALVHDLAMHPESKAVVFSDWRKTLDLTARALYLCGIPFLRYDGSVKERERAAALERFSKDPEKKVILFTIRCGAVGLDLTAADRVYLMEPQWNPTIEDQAFARVHRMGQTKPVTAVRFVMADSYEQKVVSRQGRKKTFADLALSPKKSPAIGGGWDQWKAVIG